jgi:hypothetical protein
VNSDTVHLIERVADAAGVYRQLSATTQGRSILLDLTAGHVDGVSKLEAESADAPDHETWLHSFEVAHEIAETSRAEYVRWISDAGNQKILDGKSIKEWFTYNGELSLWWMTQTAQKGQIGSPCRWLFYAFAFIDLAFQRGHVPLGARWHLWVPDQATGVALQQYLGDRGTAVVHADTQNETNETVRLWISHNIVRPLRRIVLGLRVSRHMRRERKGVGIDTLFGSGTPRVLVATLFPKSWRTIPETERFAHGITAADFYLGSMPWHLRAEGIGVAWLRTSSSIGDHKKWKRKAVANQDLPDATAWAVIGVRAAFDLFRNQLSWSLDHHRLFVRGKVQDQWRYRGTALGYWIVKDYTDLCRGDAVARMLQLEQYRSAVEALRPDAVLYRDEMFFSGRILTAGTKGRTRLIGLQHGIINNEATVYCFDKRDVTNGREDHDHVAHCPVPDLFMAFGEYTREHFRRWGGYDASRVIPIGGVRHDHLAHRFVMHGEEPRAVIRRVREHLAIPLEGPILLLCTHRTRLAGQWFELVLDGLDAANLAAFVLVKLHPYHGGEQEIREVAARRGFSGYGLFNDSIYPLIASSDAVVAGASTVILESYLLDTPVISIAGSVGYETYPFRQEGLGTVVRSKDAMAAALASALGGTARSGSEFELEREEVLRRHLWNHDAGANQRLVEVLRGLSRDPEDRDVLIGVAAGPR